MSVPGTWWIQRVFMRTRVAQFGETAKLKELYFLRIFVKLHEED